MDDAGPLRLMTTPRPREPLDEETDIEAIMSSGAADRVCNGVIT